MKRSLLTMLGLVVAAQLGGGCAQQIRVPQAPTAPQAAVLDTAQLDALRNTINALPAVPQAPKPKRFTVEEYAYRPPAFYGTTAPVPLVSTPERKGPSVTV